MLRNKLLILLSLCSLSATAAWADDVGYVDCPSHSEDTPVFAKASKTPDVVANVPCGERFTILIYGFVFSRIQTRDGKIGYIYSNLIAVDRSAASVQKSASTQMVTASARTPVYKQEQPANAARPSPPVAAQPQPAPVQSAPTQAAPAQTSAPTAPVAPSTTPEIAVTSAPTTPPATAQSQPAPADVFPTPPPTPAETSSPTSNASETPASAVQPDRNTAAQPAPAPAHAAPAETVAPAVRPADARSSWEKPIPSARSGPRFELYGGYSFARLDGGGGSATNLNGAMGSFGWNIKPWLQIVGDSSYSFVTVSGTKNVLYGNHYGPRYFYHKRNRWNITPFAEAFFGATRADTTVSGAGGYTTSDNCFSIKVGGGLDFHPSRRFEIRLFDVDYYRTSFGTNAHQNNYWASAGIVIRLFGGGGAE
jgi:hypothetical protein